MNKDETYNGWVNFDTWAAYTWISGDYDTCKAMEYRPTAAHAESIWQNYFKGNDGVVISNVKWSHVARAFKG